MCVCRPLNLCRTVGVGLAISVVWSKGIEYHLLLTTILEVVAQTDDVETIEPRLSYALLWREVGIREHCMSVEVRLVAGVAIYFRQYNLRATSSHDVACQMYIRNILLCYGC